MAEKKPRRLYPVYCKKCKQLLCWAIADSETHCPACGTWTKTEQGKQTAKTG